mgnify:FL=1|tara:strand:+ start:1757 stop:1999 length:243 start_codon:yes stop_codon:yes gene_type:complete
MSITATLRNANAINVQMRSQSTIAAKSMQVGISPKLTTLTDVDATELADGALLVYNATTGKFQTKPELDNSSTIVNGGKY